MAKGRKGIKGTKRRQREEINSYIIPLDTMKDMDDMIRLTHETGKEHGMSLCVDKTNHEIRTGFKSVGTDMGIAVSEDCKKKSQKYIGSFHTHPDDSETAASALDLFSSCLKISNLDCIGKNERGEIVCYEKKEKGTSCVHDAKPMKDVEDVLHEIPYGQAQDIKKELYREVDRIANRHFNVHKVK